MATAWKIVTIVLSILFLPAAGVSFASHMLKYCLWKWEKDQIFIQFLYVKDAFDKIIGCESLPNQEAEKKIQEFLATEPDLVKNQEINDLLKIKSISIKL